MYPIYETALALGVPVMITSSHVIGPDMSYAMPHHIQHVALDFPELTIIVGHAVRPWVTQACALAMRCTNVYLMPEIYMHVAGIPGSDDYVRAANGYLSHRMLGPVVLPVPPPRPGVGRLSQPGHLSRVAGEPAVAQRRAAPRRFLDRCSGGVEPAAGAGRADVALDPRNGFEEPRQQLGQDCVEGPPPGMNRAVHRGDDVAVAVVNRD